jgi:sec-independent protein translocase protein TatA
MTNKIRRRFIMGSFGLTEIIILFLIIVIMFGAKRIPDLFRAVGSSIKGFKKELNQDDEKKV